MPVTAMHMVARFQHRSGLPANMVELTVNARFPDTPSTLDRASAATEFIEFFNTIPTGGGDEPGNFLSEALSRTSNASQILIYETTDLSGATPFGAPTATSNFTLINTFGGNELPEEIACCLTYHGDLTDVPVSEVNPSPPPAFIRPRQRRTGRVYFGPLNAQAGVDTAGLFRPTSSFRTILTLGFKEFATEFAAATTGDIAVWSKADEELYVIDGGYMDDAWDVQRRRGPVPSARTTFSM